MCVCARALAQALLHELGGLNAASRSDVVIAFLRQTGAAVPAYVSHGAACCNCGGKADPVYVLDTRSQMSFAPSVRRPSLAKPASVRRMRSPSIATPFEQSAPSSDRQMSVGTESPVAKAPLEGSLGWYRPGYELSAGAEPMLQSLSAAEEQMSSTLLFPKRLTLTSPAFSSVGAMEFKADDVMPPLAALVTHHTSQRCLPLYHRQLCFCLISVSEPS